MCGGGGGGGREYGQERQSNETKGKHLHCVMSREALTFVAIAEEREGAVSHCYNRECSMLQKL